MDIVQGSQNDSSSDNDDNSTQQRKKSKCVAVMNRDGGGVSRNGMSGNKESSSSGSGSKLDECIQRLSRRVGRSFDLTTKAHENGVRVLLQIRDKIFNGQQASADCNILLVCCGVSMERRRLLKGEKDECYEDYMRTAVLIFVTVCLIEHQRRGELEDEEADRHVEILRRSSSMSLWSRVRFSKLVDDAAATAIHRPDAAAAVSQVAVLDPTSTVTSVPKSKNELRPWKDVIEEMDKEWKSAPMGDGEVAYAAVCSGVMLLEKDDIKIFEALSEIFYRHTALQLASKSLNDAASANFLSLSAVAYCGTINSEGVSQSKCKALISAGESEAGQQVMRDMVLSFLLPSSLVRVRRTLLLSREVAAKATVDYTDIVQFAHETAMEGLEWTWEHSKHPLKLTCALLTAIACLTTREGDDPIRKADAFSGLVNLPFFNTSNVPQKKMRVALVPESRRWVLFSMEKGAPVIQS